MPSLAEIVKDPAFVNANPATRAAIFDKWAPQDPAYTGANEATKNAIRAKYGLAGGVGTSAQPGTDIAAPAPAQAGGTTAGRTDVPAWGRENPRLYGVAGALRETLAPLVEAGGMIVGGLGGTTAAGPAGGVVGAGAGYAGARGLVRAADVALGNEAPETPVQALARTPEDMAMGMAMEAGGQVLAPVVGKVAGKIMDVGKGAAIRAGKIARQAVGQDAEAIQAGLATAERQGLTPAQATAEVNSPTWQALLQRAAGRDPRFFGAGGVTPAQTTEATNKLAVLAGGRTQTNALNTQGEMKNALNARLIPQRDIELNAANTAGQLKPVLDAEAERMGAAAAGKVEDVRRFTAAAERAGETRAATREAVRRGAPTTQQYQYTGELMKRAEQVAEQSAAASLPFGEASRFAQAASASLEAHGLRPLTAESVTGNIKAALTDAKLAGNRDASTVMNRVIQDIEAWTNNGGVIDAFALDSIRKNSVNGAIQALYPGANSRVQKEAAAKVLATIRPAIDDAIEKAGGTGYKAYLDAYSAGRNAIDQKVLNAKALEMYQTAPTEFVNFVRGNKPDVVEKVFGPGSYDIAKQMTAGDRSVMRKIARTEELSTAATAQASLGREKLREILQDNISKFKIPWGISPKGAAVNQLLDVAERKLGRKVMDTLTEAAKSGKSMSEILKTLPAYERNVILQTMSDPTALGIGTKGAHINAMIGDNRNSLNGQ